MIIHLHYFLALILIYTMNFYKGVSLKWPCQRAGLLDPFTKRLVFPSYSSIIRNSERYFTYMHSTGSKINYTKPYIYMYIG